MKKHLFMVLLFSIHHLAAPAQNLSQTRTAHVFNWNGNNPYLNLWFREGPQYVSADDNSYAYSKKLTTNNWALFLLLQDFHFDIPSEASIVSINVTARRFKKGKADIRDYFASLLITGSGIYNPAFYGVRWMLTDNYPDMEASASYFQSGSGHNGGFSGNMVYQWTPAMINASTFGIRIDTYFPTKGSLTVYYDYVQITVEYSMPAVPSRIAPDKTEIKPIKTPVIYPNPFTTKTNLQFTATESGNTVIALYNITGARMRTLFSGNMIQDQVYNIEIGDADLPKGIYVYVISNNQQKYSGRITKIE